MASFLKGKRSLVVSPHPAQNENDASIPLEYTVSLRRSSQIALNYNLKIISTY